MYYFIECITLICRILCKYITCIIINRIIKRSNFISHLGKAIKTIFRQGDSKNLRLKKNIYLWARFDKIWKCNFQNHYSNVFGFRCSNKLALMLRAHLKNPFVTNCLSKIAARPEAIGSSYSGYSFLCPLPMTKKFEFWWYGTNLIFSLEAIRNCQQ